MVKKSKRLKTVESGIDKNKKYDMEEAVELLKAMPKRKFDETVEIAMNLGIDTKHADQMVRGSFSLPNGIGKTVRVIAFAGGSDIEKAKESGAVEAGEDDLIKKVTDGWLDFDVAVAHKSLMPKVGKLGRFLGPKGLMPSPKTGTVTENIADAVKEFVAGKVEYRADDGGSVHCPIGKLSFPGEQIVENARTFIEHIHAQRPAGAKGIFIKKVCISSTMGPGIAIKVE